jgi:hypothetical protein
LPTSCWRSAKGVTSPLFLHFLFVAQHRQCLLHAGDSALQGGMPDTPSFGQPLMLAVEVRRFKCINSHCPHQTSSERIDPFAAAGQRRTKEQCACARHSAGWGIRLAAPLPLGWRGAWAFRTPGRPCRDSELSD